MNVKAQLLTGFLLSLCMLSVAQKKPIEYEAEWKIVDSLAFAAKLPQSALKEVENIHAQALREKNEPQVLRALVYRVELEEKTEEKGKPKGIEGIEREIAMTAQPAKSILQSILASMYWRYFMQVRWQIYGRTNTTNFAKDDPETWTANDFYRKIGGLYLKSLEDEKLLMQTRLDSFAPVIVSGNSRIFRPTLFDLLAHEALEYFKAGESMMNKPANSFVMDDPAVFADAAGFAAYRFPIEDSISLQAKALLLFQRLIRLHQADERPEALTDIDIERIRFAYDNTVVDSKDSLYMHALQRLTLRNPDGPASAMAWYYQAHFYYWRAIHYKEPGYDIDGNGAGAGGDDRGDNGGSSSAVDETHDSGYRYDNVKAKAICERVMLEKDSSAGKAYCSVLLNTITWKTLTIQTEKCNIPGKPMRALVIWRNVPTAWIRIVRVDSLRNVLEDYNYSSDGPALAEKLKTLPAVYSFRQDLPQTGDYLQHQAEIRIPALLPGMYAVLAGSDSAFSGNKIRHISILYVTSIAFIQNGSDFFVVNRETGKSLPGAKVQVWHHVYDNSRRRYRDLKLDSMETDAHGHFRLFKSTGRVAPRVHFDISTTGDRFYPIDQDYTSPFGMNDGEGGQPASYERNHVAGYLFTDRSIYRPGQTIYIKGIVVTKDAIARLPKIWPGFKTLLGLYDRNGVKVDSLELETNEYGSYHGKLRIPDHRLNGVWLIKDDSAKIMQVIRVEEYKRPTFFVDYDKLGESYRLGDSVHVTGFARAYAGNQLNGAGVKYRVTRRVRSPLPGFYGRAGFLRAESQEIAHGETHTGLDGKFHVSFLASPDRTIGKSLDPLFTYIVTADVTDINGETRSGDQIVSAGYKALELQIDMPGGKDHLPADSLKEIRVSATNHAGQAQISKVKVNIYSLAYPHRLIRARLWADPDQFIMSAQEYLDSFPHDEYRHETKMESWERGRIVFASSLVTDSSRLDGTTMSIPPGSLGSGWWLIEAETEDAFGQRVKTTHYIELFDTRTGAPPMPAYTWDLDHHPQAEPGEKASIEIGSSANDVHVIRRIERMPVVPLSMEDSIRSPFSYFSLDREKAVSSFTVAESDRGGFGVADVFVKDNRLYNQVSTVDVPWSNKELRISYSSFRDKTLPGSSERWEVKISGTKGERVATEVLTAMYDASLDAFAPHGWTIPRLYPLFSFRTYWINAFDFKQGDGYPLEPATPPAQFYFARLDDRILQPGELEQAQYTTRMAYGISHDMNPDIQRYLGGRPLGFQPIAPAHFGFVGNQQIQIRGSKPFNVDDAAPFRGNKYEADLAIGYSERKDIESGQNGIGTGDRGQVQIRKNFNETAFFLPDLRTDSAGDLAFSFTMPEALTRWKWMMMAHTKELGFGYSEKEIITQKKLMLVPNAPRFLREGDRMQLSAKVVNMTDSELTGQMELQLIDPTTEQTADGLFSNRQPNQYFTVGAGQSAVVNFPIDIPYQYSRPLSFRLVARARDYSDGEESTLPVVSNRMLVTETLPLNMPGDGEKKFVFEKLLQSGNSETLNHHALTVEFTSNPAWYAVQALPYLAEYPYECAEQIFNRFYANALASKIANSSPRLKQVFEKWRTEDKAALLSNLEKNQELKSILLEETPWVMEGKSESEQKRRVALLFDMTRMSGELASALDKLTGMQSDGGGFAWFKGGRDDRYITQYVLTGIGRLSQMNAIPPDLRGKVKTLVDKAMPFVDEAIRQDYEDWKKAQAKAGTPGKEPGHLAVIGGLPVQYLYMRSLFNEYGISGSILPAVSFYRKAVQKLWTNESKYLQGMIALALFRTGDIQTAKNIVASLRENAIRDPEKGMYWKGMEGGYYWWEAPIEMESLLIEAFRVISGDPAVDRDLKTWLLRQKQTQNWPTTKATADACYALLSGNENWLAVRREVDIKLGEKEATSFKPQASSQTDDKSGRGEEGTGYFKKVFDGPFVSPGMGNITVTMRTVANDGGTGAGGKVDAGGKAGGKAKAEGGSPAWGAVYWQYFDNLDRITPTGGGKAPLKVSKKLFVERNTANGPVLDPVMENGDLKVGDKVRVRIELRVDRYLEYVHMKDMRASCMEPVNVLSQYKWQDGLGYYETTKDVSTEFFFSQLPQGTYVFEYSLFVGQTGNFSNGVTSIECMYAPEFADHSEGIRVNVEEAPGK